MSKKDDEKKIGEIFIAEYNRQNHTTFRVDEYYLQNRKENEFPDLKFINGREMLSEVVRAVNQEIMKEMNNYNDLDLIPCDPENELFLAIEKKQKKNYSGASEIILLIHMPHYAEKNDISAMVPTIQKHGFTFKGIWAVWEDDEKAKPLKLQ
ncbi:MAG: hypothetical protein J7L34_03795 [Thermotogaceae bacterium]|nr:hypothetical protein [Thermotogaceae bacterium]